MNARNELAEAMQTELDPDLRQYHPNHFEQAADALLAAGWSKTRTVDSIEELEALPDLSVVIDKHDDVSQKRGGRWCGYETADLTSKQLAKYKPIRVLPTPGGEG